MNSIHNLLSFDQGSNIYRFLPTGDIFTFTSNDYLINQFRGNARDGSLNNIYLRVYQNDKMCAYPLLGIKSNSKLAKNKNTLSFTGTAAGIAYTVLFQPAGSIWFWTVSLTGHGEKVDLVYGQDIGAATQGTVFSNELYNSQYLGHSVFQVDGSYVVCSRQNMQSGGQFPYIQQGVIGCNAVHYTTDGIQFFGLSSKEDGVPVSLAGNLNDVNLQYEFAYTALQTNYFIVNGRQEVTFYGIFKENHSQAVTSVEFQSELQEAFSALLPPKNLIAVTPVTPKAAFSTPLISQSFTDEDFSSRYPVRKLVEKNGNVIYSFFTDDHAHIVTKEKELVTERPHGTIVISCPNSEKVASNLIASTQYMYGVFGSHIVTGNTDMHKFISSARGFLNLLRNGGMRIYVSINGTYHLLNLPGVFEMGMNYSRWLYKLENDILCITGYTAAENADFILEVTSESGICYDFIVTSQISMGPNEHVSDITCSNTVNGLRFTGTNPVYPQLHYDILFYGTEFKVSDDRIFFEENTPFDKNFLTLSVSCKNSFTLGVHGSMEAEYADFQPVIYDFITEKNKVLQAYSSLLRNFELNHREEKQELSILNETAWWYTHNAMIHFAMPHGLEQPGGAAWGTRDICQGPMEYFLTTQHNAVVRDILLNIFRHQNFSTREWPQWFMFDHYPINAGECHGDVIFWPLKSIADYIGATGDEGILYQTIPYDDEPEQKEPLISHIRLALSNIKETRFIGNSGLLTYAGGDWDDTLQPAGEALKQHLVSSWTMALAFQAFSSLAAALPAKEATLSSELAGLAATIKHAFETILTKDGVISGFMEHKDGIYHPLLHPDDKKTGIHFRLLPMTRSIISELAAPAQAEKNTALIHAQLKCPDGVRLMDKPADYQGGVSHLFKRAEQAANVGREVSLQYVHAHIRYIEAMTKLGRSEDAWKGLFQINPILLSETVPNAGVRQSNMYFSSSEGAYPDRYEYARDFHKLKDGTIAVKGGWRLYSSGPGIYLHQVIGHILGIRFSKDGLIIDPVLPADLDGITFTYRCFENLYTFRYSASPQGELTAAVNGKALSVKKVDNPYRRSAILIPKESLPADGSTIIISF